MSKKEAEIVLKCWLECPCAFNVGGCEKQGDEYCEYGCWSIKQVKEAVKLLLQTEI